jgi:AcrR family transcriptional regulator
LLDAAERLWAERGIHGASLDDVSSAAGLTKGAVYSNFTGKTDLVLALLERHTGRGGGPDAMDVRLLVEFWLYGMRDYAAGWRIADWCAAHRADRAVALGCEAAATREMALDLGMAMLHLLDPERVQPDP